MAGTLPTWATDPQAATPPLDEYLAAEEKEPTLFWRLGCGHHENLLDDAIQQRDAALAEVETLRSALEMAAQSHIQLEGELREATSIAGLNCAECGADISEYAKGLTLCAICDSEVDDK